MFTDRYFWKSSQQSRTVLVGLIFCTTLGLQSCNFLQTQKSSESNKPSVKANPAQGSADPLSKPLPISQQGQVPNMGQPMSAGANNKVKIDPITGLPVIADGPGASNPATAMDPSLKTPVTSTTGGTTINNSALTPNTARDLSKPLLKSAPAKPIAAKSPSPAKGAPTQAGVTPLKPSVNEPFNAALPALQAAPPADAAVFNPGGPIPANPAGPASASSPAKSSFGNNPSGFSSGASNSGSSSTGVSATPANGAASTSASSNSSGGGTAATSNSGTSSAPSGSGSGYVYDPSTAAYRPANSLPVWSPGGNASNPANPTQPASP
jgi:hypothetical protein